MDAAPAGGVDRDDDLSPFAGGGSMGEAMAGTDWSATSLGAVETWPTSLRTVVNLCLTSRAPTMVVWGPDHIQLYNDALAPHLGGKHPAALGRPYHETFAEIWDDLQGPLLRKVYEHGESVHVEDTPVFFHRAVPNEEMFWTFSWSPLRDEEGSVVGAFHPAMEVTGRVLAERRLRLLRDLAATAGQALSVQDCLGRAADVLASSPEDLPFTAFYLVEEERGAEVPLVARLAAARGLTGPDAVLPAEVDLVGSGYSPWPLRLAVETGEPQTVSGLDLSGAAFESTHWPELPSTAVVLPVPRPDQDAPAALFVAGVSARRPLDRELMDFLQLLAGQLATAVRTARLVEQQHRVALTLQRSLLPEGGEAVGLEVAARYLPGSAEAEVGGDWYDVIGLSAGRTAVVIGDVMGRGVRAAAVMGQLRAAVRAYALLDLPPERVLALLDRLVEEMSTGASVGQIVTCIYAVYDPAEAEVVLASAGHPPPVLLTASSGRIVDAPVGPPLGFGRHDYSSVTLALPPGHGLMLYTDGLVEVRGEHLDDGMDRLLRTVDEADPDDLERLADAALEAVGDGRHDDDVAVVAVRVPTSTDERVRGRVVDLRGRAQVARVARAATSEVLAAWGLPVRLVDSAVSVAAELVTNAVAHTPGPQQLRLRLLPDRVTIEVTDTDDRPPQRLTGGPTVEGGRGLLIVSALATDWGVRPLGTGKVVWAEISVES